MSEIKKRWIIAACGLALYGPYGHCRGTLSLGHLQRHNTVSDATSDFNSFAELSLVRLQRQEEGFSYQYDLGVRKYNNSVAPLYALSEAYATYRKNNLVVSAGRKRVQWNEASRHWTMGEIFATKGFHLARDEQEGISGLHLEYKKGPFFMHAVASNVFIPQLNPGVEILNGRIGPKSEWSNPPPTQVEFEGQQIPIIYDVEMPNAADYVRQNTFALALGFESEWGRFSVYGGRKPETGPRINASGFLALDNGGQVTVLARPFANQQNFYGGAWHKQWNKNFQTSLDYHYISPDRGEDQSFVFEGFSIEPVYTNISYSSFHSRWSSDFFSLSLSGLKAFKTYEASDATFEKRLRWHEALSLQIELSPIERMVAGARYQRDLERRDSVFTAFASWRWNRKLSSNLEYLQIEAPTDQSFWSAFRSNDLWQVNLNYLF